YGGLNLIEFHQDDSVSVKAIDCLDQTKKDLEENLIMLYTGITRSASDILQKQNQNLVSNKEKSIIMKHMVQLTYELQKELENNNLDNFGAILHENRELKKQMAGGISSGQIDEWYMKALRAGATGGKLLGAGGGGFLLFYAPKEKHDDIKKALSDLKELEFRLDERGSRVTEIV
ncbi:MAG TPA: hypothetical protein PKC14_02815, partial [Candidatus Absconditabacterales bacterium]|nr:hypothetical protein [Candidatus Absconditabacterales bacterium]